MNTRRAMMSIALLLGPLIAGCPGKDSELRTYIESTLRPYLDSVARQTCRSKKETSPTNSEPDTWLCPHGPPDGYTPPTGDGPP